MDGFAASGGHKDLACALRAVHKPGLSEGACSNFSGLLWTEVGPDDLVVIDSQGHKFKRRHDLEPTASSIRG